MKVEYKYIGNERTDAFKEVSKITLEEKELKKALKEIDKWGMFLCIAFLNIGKKRYTIRKNNFSGIVYITNTYGDILSSDKSYNSNNQNAISMFCELKKLV